MKTLCTLIFLSFICIGIASCKKTNNGPASVVHRWNIVKDSIYSNANSPDYHGTSYPGNPAEFFYFSANGMFYFSDHNSNGVDSLKYQVLSDTTILIAQTINGEFYTFSDGNANGIWRISNLTDHTLIISTQGAGPEIGLAGEIFQLSR